MSDAHPRHRIGILGGTGFVGRVLCARLLADGHDIVVLTRDAERHRDLARETLRLRRGDVHDRAFLTTSLEGCDVVINLIGILNERGHSGREFQAVHSELPRTLGRVCRDLGVSRVLHMGALGAQAGSSPSRYLRSKGEGANALQVELGGRIPWTLFKPSTIFGPGDGFTCRFARLLRRVPGPFPLACADTRMAPVYVGDVAEAFARCLDDADSERQRYQLCGPEIFTLEEAVRLVAETLGRHPRIWRLPDPLARLQAAIMEYLPGKPFTRDNYMSLQVDSVPDGREPGLAELGIEPTSLRTELPRYLPVRSS